MTERAPLLPSPSIEDDHCESNSTYENLTYTGELVRLIGETLPISLSFALQNAIQAYSIFLAGGIGTFELGVASYGYMFASCTGSMVAIGGATALDTLCSHTFTAKNRTESVPLLGTYLQRSLLILSALFICFVSPIWWFSGRIFLALGQEQDFALATGVFLRIFIPGGLLQVVAESLKKFLQVQGSSNAVGWASTFAGIIGVMANFILIRAVQVGLAGAPIAHTIYHLATVIFLLVYILTSSAAKRNWGGFTVKAWNGWRRFSSLALLGILTVATEWWAFEFLAIMAARLDSVSIATQSIIMTSDLVFATIPLGLGVASSHRVGSLLGGGDAKSAKFALRMTYIFALLFGLIEFVILISVRDVYGLIFTDSEPVVELTAHIMPLMAGFQVLDIGNGGAGGNLRGGAKNHLSAACNLTGYYGVGLIAAWYLCFEKNFGLFGLWAGLITGSGAVLVLQTIAIVLVDWKKEAEKISGSAKGGSNEEANTLLDASP